MTGLPTLTGGKGTEVPSKSLLPLGAGRRDRWMPREGGQIAYRFHARDLHLVMGPAAPGTSVRFHVRIDGQPPGAAHAADVDDEGNGTVAGQPLHHLIRQPGPVTDHIFEITFLDPGAEVYAFTFS